MSNEAGRGQWKLKTDFGVRALLGVLIVGPATGTLAYLAINGSGEALTALATMGSAVMAFYFGQRSVAQGRGEDKRRET